LTIAALYSGYPLGDPHMLAFAVGGVAGGVGARIGLESVADHFVVGDKKLAKLRVEIKEADEAITKGKARMEKLGMKVDEQTIKQYESIQGMLGGFLSNQDFEPGQLKLLLKDALAGDVMKLLPTGFSKLIGDSILNLDLAKI